MKSKILENIIQQIAEVVAEPQLAKIQSIIENELKRVSVSSLPNAQVAIRKSNEQLLSAFISAKRIEGCSEKTLKYYENTIASWLEENDVAIADVTTNDIRRYLSAVQSKRNSSKVTIDNIRRIFSSFFSWLEDGTI